MASEIWGEGEATPKLQVLINGESVGEADQSELAGAVITRFASEHGIRRFTVRTNGQAYSDSAANRTSPLSGVSTLEIFTKDAQG